MAQEVSPLQGSLFIRRQSQRTPVWQRWRGISIHCVPSPQLPPAASHLFLESFLALCPHQSSSGPLKGQPRLLQSFFFLRGHTWQENPTPMFYSTPNCLSEVTPPFASPLRLNASLPPGLGFHFTFLAFFPLDAFNTVASKQSRTDTTLSQNSVWLAHSPIFHTAVCCSSGLWPLPFFAATTFCPQMVPGGVRVNSPLEVKVGAVPSPDTSLSCQW